MPMKTARTRRFSCRRPGHRGIPGMGPGFCHSRIEAIISMDERGQVVLPKDVREELGLEAGEKLAIIVHEGRRGIGGGLVMLVKAKWLADGLRGMLGPMLRDILDESEGKEGDK